MKFSSAFLVVLPLLISNVAAATIPGPLLAARQDNERNRNGGGRNNNNQGKNNQGKNANQGKGGNAAAGAGAANNGTAAAGGAANNSTAAAGGAANNSTANAGAGNNAAGNNNAGNNADAQTSLTLDPRVVAKGFAQNGQDPPVDGQVASLTSTNNFINFCLTVPNLPITDGKQVTTGSCNPAPIGTIPSVDNMPSSKFVFPKNGGSVTPNTAFTIQMAIKNLATGNFVNAQANYFAAPQQLNGAGQILGHSHVVVEQLTAIDQTTPTDPRKFAFFKGLNAAAAGGVLTADVTAGLPAGAYRLCSINTSSNHQPAIVPVAQHGMLDDCVYFTSGAAAAGAANGGAANGGAANGGAANGGAAASSAAAATATAKGGAAAASATAKGGAAAASASASAAAGKGGNNNAGKGANADAGTANNNQGQNRGGRNNRRFFRF